MRYNPFNFLFETPYAPYSRLLRTSIAQKLNDTFLIFLGQFSTHPDYKNKTKHILFDIDHIDKNLESFTVGLFDYITLGIPLTLAVWSGRLLFAVRQLKQKHHDTPLSLPKENTWKAWINYRVERLFRFFIYLIEPVVAAIFLFCHLFLHCLPRVGVGLLGVFFVGLLITLPIGYLIHLYAKHIKNEAFELRGVTAVKAFSPNHQNFMATDTDFNLNNFFIQNKARSQVAVVDTEHYETTIVSDKDQSDQCHYYLKVQINPRYVFYAELNQINLSQVESLLQLNFAHAVDSLLFEMNKNPAFKTYAKSEFSDSRFFKALTSVGATSEYAQVNLVRKELVNH